MKRKDKLVFDEFSGHCEPVTDVTGVAISRIEVQFLVDEFRKTVQKYSLYDDR